MAFYKKKYPEKRQLERQIAKFDKNDPQWTLKNVWGQFAAFEKNDTQHQFVKSCL